MGNFRIANMRNLLIFIIFISLSGCRQTNHATTEESIQQSLRSVGREYDREYGRPLIVLFDNGTRVPTFALYEKNRIIYRISDNDSIIFYDARLTQAEFDKFMQSLGSLTDFYELEDNIIASDIKSDAVSTIILNIDVMKEVIIYGNLDDIEVRFHTPYAFKRILDRTKSYRNDSAKMWVPQIIEVEFYDYKNAISKRPWIKGFPDLTSSTTVKLDEHSYSVFLDYSDYDEFMKYYKTMGDREAVEINGRMMAISYRLPFPNIM